MTEYVPQDLVNAFVASAARHFRGLEQTYQLQRSLEAEVLGSSGFQRLEPETIGNRFFMLKLTLTGPRFVVVVSYGDREHDFCCLVRASAHKCSYALWEWLAVLGKPERLQDAGGWGLTAPRIEAVLTQYEHALEQLAPVLATADSALEHQLENLRQENIRRAQQQMAEEEHRRQASRAAEAFHRQDYATVLDAYSSVSGELSPGEKAKLAYAKKQLDH